MNREEQLELARAPYVHDYTQDKMSQCMALARWARACEYNHMHEKIDEFLSNVVLSKVEEPSVLITITTIAR